MKLYFGHIETPFGMCCACVDEDGALVEFNFNNEFTKRHVALIQVGVHDQQSVSHVANQVDEFFAKKRHEFTLTLAPRGTDFQRKVWQALCDIPYGATISYQELAIRIGNKKACQAVGSANGKNPIALIIPCHRVIGKSGSLTGYGGGLDLKQGLLDFETPRLI